MKYWNPPQSTERASQEQKEQIVALFHKNTRVTDKKNILQLVTKYYSYVYKAPVIPEKEFPHRNETSLKRSQISTHEYEKW